MVILQEKLEEREEEIQRLKHEPQEKKTIVEEQQNVLATDIVNADVDVDVDVNAVTPIEVENEN